MLGYVKDGGGRSSSSRFLRLGTVKEEATVQVQMGQALREVRQRQGRSLRSVAAVIGVSPSMLSQVETGKTQPSVGTLYALVNHLGVGIDELLQPAGAAPAMSSEEHSPPELVDAPGPLAPLRGPVQRASDNPRIEMQAGVVWERLCVGSNEGIVDPLMVSYEPGAMSATDGRFTRHSGIEYGVLLDGELTLQLDFDTYVLTPGDSLCFESQRPHLYSNRSSQPARGVWYVLGGDVP